MCGGDSQTSCLPACQVPAMALWVDSLSLSFKKGTLESGLASLRRYASSMILIYQEVEMTLITQVIP